MIAIPRRGHRCVVRLNLAPWIASSGQVLLVLHELGTAPVRPGPHKVSASWVDLSGKRVLVYSGPIKTAVLEETLTFQIEADGGRLPV